MAGVSAWNAAGTWEERDFSDWSHKRIKEKLNAVSWRDGENHFTVTSDVVTGDAFVVFVKGKKRLGFDLEIKVKWRGKINGADFSGSGVITLESDTGGDCDFALKHESDHGKSLEAELKRAISAEIKAWKDELILK